MTRISAARIAALQQKILAYYDEHGRDLPWRQEPYTSDAYSVLVSEVMLQQTQVDRVIPYYLAWLAKWPTFDDLATAQTPEVLKMWSGLGYNSRALRLQKLAQEIVENYDGALPHDEQSLLALPGIGPYTANSVRAFAFNDDNVSVVDTNIRRVLIHELGLSEDISVKDLEVLARRCVPSGRSRDWHNALMDYGATQETARKTGIKPISQQSKFSGSDREVRGWIVKQLVAGNVVTLEKVKTQFPKKDVKGIVAKMEKDGVVQVEQEKLHLG